MSITPPTPPDFPLPTDSPEDFDDKAYDCFPYVAAAANNAYVNAQASESAASDSEDSADASALSELASANSVVENTALTAAYVARHQGAHTTAPTTRNGGAPLQDKDLFVYTGTTGGGYTNGLTYIWSSGSSTWGVFTVPGINVPKFQIITSNTTWTKSAKFIEGSMRISGIGGGASGCSSGDASRAGANSGEAVYRVPVDVSGISSAAIVIGAGGTSVNGGGANTAGVAGGATTFGSLLTLAGAAATPVTGRAATVGGAFGGIHNTTIMGFAAQKLGIAIAGSEGSSDGTISTAQANGAGGIIVNDTGTKAGDASGAGSARGGIGYGAGGATSTNTSASGAGAPGVLVLEWEETR